MEEAFNSGSIHLPASGLYKKSTHTRGVQPQSMLTRQELSLLRAALAYWSEEIMMHPLPSDVDTQNARLNLSRLEPRLVELLYNRLAEHNMHYIVVDTLLNHVVNTRLFKFPPNSNHSVVDGKFEQSSDKALLDDLLFNTFYSNC